VVCDHPRGQHPSEPLNSHEERNLTMRHEPSGSRPPVQPDPARRCLTCRTARLPDEFPTPTGTRGGCCAACRRHKAAVVRRCNERALRQLTRRQEASYQALLVRYAPRGGGGGAA
jgi:hypothetical protein